MSQISQALGLPPSQKQPDAGMKPEKLKFNSDPPLSSIKSAQTEKSTLPQKMRPEEDESMEALHKKLADLKQELEMSPRKFEEKLLDRLK